MRGSWLLLVPLALSLSGCAGIWNALNRDALHSDVSALFLKHGSPITGAECHMLDLSRDAVCVLNAYDNQIGIFTTGVGLRPVGQDEEIARLVQSVETSKTGSQGCLTEPGFTERDKLQVYATGQRPATLRLPNGTAFEYLILYQHPEKRQVCLQLSYASG